jgi:curved DNA-binding protein CbpA
VLNDVLARWLVALESMDYYAVLGAPTNVDADALQARYHLFCSNFHPDAHRGRSDEDRAAVRAIYQRGNEAYRVLRDPTQRERYNVGLARGERRLTDLDVQADNRQASVSMRPQRLEDTIRNPSAKAFARKAEEHLERGELKQAKLTVKMAMSMEPGNPALTAFAARVAAASTG